jgi:hypothetical protein
MALLFLLITSAGGGVERSLAGRGGAGARVLGARGRGPPPSLADEGCERGTGCTRRGRGSGVVERRGADDKEGAGRGGRERGEEEGEEGEEVDGEVFGAEEAVPSEVAQVEAPRVENQLHPPRRARGQPRLHLARLQQLAQQRRCMPPTARASGARRSGGALGVEDIRRLPLQHAASGTARSSSGAGVAHVPTSDEALRTRRCSISGACDQAQQR